MNYLVKVFEILEDGLEEEVKRLGPYSSKRKAEKVESALDSKIDHDKFYCGVFQSLGDAS